MVVFICNSPFQLLSAIIIRKQYYAQMDAMLILTDASKALRNYAVSDLTHLFEEVYFVDIYNTIKNIPGIENVEIPDERINTVTDSIIKNLDLKNVTDIFYANLHSWIYHFINFYNDKTIRTHYYEDGMDSYLVDISVPYCKRPSDVFVYQPSLLLNNNDYPVYKIPSVCEMPLDLQSKIDTVFNYQFINDELTDVILFEQHSDSKGDYTYMDDVFMHIIEWSNFKALIKSHPRRKKYNLEFERFRWQIDVPWELISRNNSLGKKIIVGISSRAIFTIPLMTKDRPHIVLLYRLIAKQTGKPIEWWHISEEYVRQWSILYGADRIHIPDDMDGLRTIIKKLIVDM